MHAAISSIIGRDSRLPRPRKGALPHRQTAPNEAQQCCPHLRVPSPVPRHLRLPELASRPGPRDRRQSCPCQKHSWAMATALCLGRTMSVSAWQVPHAASSSSVSGGTRPWCLCLRHWFPLGLHDFDTPRPELPRSIGAAWSGSIPSRTAPPSQPFRRRINVTKNMGGY